MSLGRKQSIDNSAWLEAVATIENAVSREELDALTAATVADIKAHTEGKAAAITETREKYAAREEAAAAQAEEIAPAQSGTASSTEPAKRFILCPKCGERIWL